MPWNEPQSWLYYALLLILGVGVLGSVPMGFLYFFKRSGERRANYFYGILLICIGLTLLHNILFITGFYDHFPQYKFFPIYFTLAFPSLLFYHVKLNLYPQYRMRATDLKHFILPVLQWLFFWRIFLSDIEAKVDQGRDFYSFFYGGLEQALYLASFFAYLYFAYRYVWHRQRKKLDARERKKVWYLRKLVKGLFVLFCIHAAFVLIDFICYEFLYINLRTVKVYAGLGALSFAALVYFMCVYGFQVLFWGRRVF